jgi:predicted Zn-dependent protease
VRALAAVALILGAAACKEPLVPTRVIYSFADTVTGNPDTVFLFRWPEARLPVRFWADRRGNMSFLVDRSVNAWQAQLLYGEFRGILVTDSTDADVIVRWTDSVPPNAAPDTTLPNSCSGVTSFDYASTGLALTGPIHVSLRVLTGGAPASPERVQGCMRRVVMHELGHALGLLRHSPNPDDLMFAQPAVNYPSSLDRSTIQTLYHLRPTIAPPPP